MGVASKRYRIEPDCMQQEAGKTRNRLEFHLPLPLVQPLTNSRKSMSCQIRNRWEVVQSSPRTLLITRECSGIPSSHCALAMSRLLFQLWEKVHTNFLQYTHTLVILQWIFVKIVTKTKQVLPTKTTNGTDHGRIQGRVMGGSWPPLRPWLSAVIIINYWTHEIIN